LEALSEVKGLEWIRLHYAYPSQFPEDILPVMANKANICKYLDIPVQHISDNVLKAMRRGITRRKTYELLNTIKEQVPGISLRTTILVGHPGETEEDFEALKQFIQDFEFDRLGVFTYSHEENTHAYTLEDNIPAEVKQQRAEALMALQEEISFKKNQKKIGQTLKVLFDRKEGEYFVGRTEADSPEVDNEVLVKAQDQFVRIGDFANIVIDSAESFDLFGHLAP
jgi:ribosomal protein S12 methylthiotransferase